MKWFIWWAGFWDYDFVKNCVSFSVQFRWVCTGTNFPPEDFCRFYGILCNIYQNIFQGLIPRNKASKFRLMINLLIRNLKQINLKLLVSKGKKIIKWTVHDQVHKRVGLSLCERRLHVWGCCPHSCSSTCEVVCILRILPTSIYFLPLGFWSNKSIYNPSCQDFPDFQICFHSLHVHNKYTKHDSVRIFTSILGFFVRLISLAWRWMKV